MAQSPPEPRGPSVWESVSDVFPFGLAPFIILVLAVGSGLFLLVQSAIAPQDRSRAALSMWTFARQHYVAYEQARPSFEKRYGVQLDLQSVHGDAVTRRLRAAYWADLDLPDAVEVEISRAGSFFRGPERGILFTDITEFLERPDPEHPRGVPGALRMRSLWHPQAPHEPPAMGEIPAGCGVGRQPSCLHRLRVVGHLASSKVGATQACFRLARSARACRMRAMCASVPTRRARDD